MAYLRLPPRIKVLEALGAIGDGRVCVVNGSTGFVASSDHNRIYDVYVDMTKGVAYSSDNGTRFRGYIGYPIIAFLMATGFLEYPEHYARALSGIPWRELNEKYKKYSIVEELVKRRAEEKGVSRKELDNYIKSVLDMLSRLRLRALSSPPLTVSIYRGKCEKELAGKEGEENA